MIPLTNRNSSRSHPQNLDPGLRPRLAKHLVRNDHRAGAQNGTTPGGRKVAWNNGEVVLAWKLMLENVGVSDFFGGKRQKLMVHHHFPICYGYVTWASSIFDKSM